LFTKEKFIDSFIPNISLTPLPVHYPTILSDAPDCIIDTVSELTRRSAKGNCEWRTCPRSLHGG